MWQTAWQLAPTAPHGPGVASTTTSRGTGEPHAAVGKTVRQLFAALWRHDRPTAEHSVRVRRCALWIAAEFRLERPHCRRLSLAALMHDIGKLCVPAALLNKPARLTPDEYRRVQMHSVTGEWILRSVLPQGDILSLVRWHHERPDGCGYPDGLKGRRIPLLARVLAVADGFDAMTNARIYRPALTWPQAVETLRRSAGSQFDADVVECLAAVIGKIQGGPRPLPEQI